MQKKCEHLTVDTWHVTTQEGREMLRLPHERRYGWRDQLRAEASGRVSRWMWPGLVALVALGIFIGDLWLIVGAVAALLFFLYQAMTLVRTLSAGDVVSASSRELTKVATEGKDPVWRAVTEIAGRRREVVVTCQQCIDALQARTTLELAVLVDRTDGGNNWLVGFREP
ncbi:MAG TPA: hypothetical protein VML75_09335 [Kofleriaceae bacterium]|nr:hypothetical protein [Kofleriaceae bacterium]